MSIDIDELPPNTVLGRTGITSGPAQAIPFTALSSFFDAQVSNPVQPENFGAIGDGFADDTAAVQAAFDTAAANNAEVYISSKTFLVSSTIKTSGVSFRGDGRLSQIATNLSIPILEINTDGGPGFAYISCTDLALVYQGAGQATSSSCGILVSGSGVLSLSLFSRLFLLGNYTGIHFAQNPGFPNSPGDHNIFTDLIIGSAGASFPFAGLDFDNGTGTGWLISNNKILVGLAAGFCIRLNSLNATNIGDIVIGNNQCNTSALTGTGLFLSPNAGYRGNIKIAGNNWGDTTTVVSANGYNFSYFANSVGPFSLSNSTAVEGDFGNAVNVNITSMERRFGVLIHSSIATVNFFQLTIPATSGPGTAGADAVFLEICAHGFVFGQGAQIRTSRYHVPISGGVVQTPQQLDTFTTGSIGVPFTITTSIAGQVVTFGLAGLGVGANALTVTIRAIGWQFDGLLIPS